MKYLLLANIIFIISSSLFAQQNDTLLVVPADTLLSAIIDTLAIEEIERKSDIDTVVYANATDSLIFFVKEKKMAIYGEGKIHYKSTEISSANIIVDFEKYEIDATGVPKDSASGELTGTPVLVEGSETYEGSKMRYNFKTGQGSLSMVDTEIEGAFYQYRN